MGSDPIPDVIMKGRNYLRKTLFFTKAAPYIFVLPFVLTVLLLAGWPIFNGVL